MSKTAEENKIKKFLNKHGAGHLTKDLPSGHNVMNLIIEYTSELEKEIQELREKIINFKFYVDCGDVSLMYENSRGDSTTAYSEMIKSLNK